MCRERFQGLQGMPERCMRMATDAVDTVPYFRRIASTHIGVMSVCVGNTGGVQREGLTDAQGYLSVTEA